MKQTLINYFISENYISDWTIQDALRELYQNFIDYGEYQVDIVNKEEGFDNYIFSNNFEPESTDLLIIGDSNKTETARGKYGEGLKMAALVILRNEGRLLINTTHFSARFILVDNEYTNIKTLGVIIDESLLGLKVNNFDVSIWIPEGEIAKYQDKLIKPIDVIHTKEGYGSIVNKPKGSLYVGGLFVCVLNDLNYAYDILPKHIQLDRDRKVPQNFEVKWAISKIQETYTEFDPTGKSQDVSYSNIPNTHISKYTPKIKGDSVIFTTIVKTKEGEKEVEVSNRFNEQLTNENFFSRMVFNLKRLIASSLNIDQMAIKFRKEYCHSNDSKDQFDVLMFRLGIDIKKLLIDGITKSINDSHINANENPF